MNHTLQPQEKVAYKEPLVLYNLFTIVAQKSDQHFIFPDSNKLRAYENGGEDQDKAKFPNNKTHSPFEYKSKHTEHDKEI